MAQSRGLSHRFGDAVNKTVFIGQIMKIVHSQLESHFYFSLDRTRFHTSLTDYIRDKEAVKWIEKTLKDWREKRENCRPKE